MPQNNCVKKGYNDLYTWCCNNGEYGKLLIDEWTGKSDNGETVFMDSVSRGTHTKVFWKCRKCLEEWAAPIKNRTGSLRTGCPHCSNNFNGGKYKKSNIKLDEWCKKNTEIGDVLIREWVGVDEKGKSVHMSQFGKGSSLKVQWRCSICGNVFLGRIGDRTNKKGGSCKDCNKQSTSYPEQYFYYALKEAFPDTKNREILWGYEYDVYVPSINLCIEYSPFFTHSDKIARDNEKRSACENNGVDFIIIREDEGYKEPSFTPSSIEIYVDYNNDKDRILRSTVEYIFSLFNIQQKIDWKRISDLAFLGSHGHIEYEDSLEFIYPELAKEWNDTYNRSRKPSSFSKCSSERVFWKCVHCGYGKKGEWEALISNRVHFKQGCPACGYNWSDRKIHQNSSTVVIKGRTDLSSLFPNLIKEWNIELNNNIKNPNEYRPSSHVRVRWTCEKCGYGKDGNWVTAIYQRVNSRSGCPGCGFNCFDGRTYDGKREVSFKKSISGMYPNLIEEWNNNLNGEKTPDQVFSGSHDPYYWICNKCGYGKKGEWNNTPNSRVNQKSGCPLCGYNSFDGSYHKTTGRNIVAPGINDIKTTCGNLWKEWHKTLNGDMLPMQFKAGSHQKIYWKCLKCGYGANGEWYKEIHARTGHRAGCPHCSYNIFDDSFHSKRRSIRATGLS